MTSVNGITTNSVFSLDEGLARKRKREGEVEIQLFSKAGKSWQKGFSILIVSLSKRRFEPDARQPKVHFLNLWAVFCGAV